MEKPLTGNMNADGSPLSLARYQEVGGYAALKKAVTMNPSSVTQEVLHAGLEGRGGAGFPTGQKWSFMPGTQEQKYFVINADEMEPGTFKDRWLMEGNPHQLIEGLLIGAYATGATHCYIFLRREYVEAARRIQFALEEAKQAGFVQSKIAGSQFSCRIDLHVSAGRYMCGEETGLLNALEGKRAIPRAKPPHPTSVGLWGRPTIVNNVETICCVPHIISKGAAWFKGLSASGHGGGTKIYGVSGKVRSPGLWELPIGTKLGEIFNHAGGMQEGLSLRALLPGGASTPFVTAEHLDGAMDFHSLASYGSRMGTGTMIVLDDKTCPVGMLLNMMQFFAHESCGWCTPCREGLPWVVKILHAIENGQGQAGDLELLEEFCWKLGPGNTFCALAPGAMEPLQSALKYFRDDFEKHIEDRRCPYVNF